MLKLGIVPTLGLLGLGAGCFLAGVALISAPAALVVGGGGLIAGIWFGVDVKAGGGK